MNLEVKVKKIYPDAITPNYASEGAACFDLRAYFSEIERKVGSLVKFAPGQTWVFDTGLSFEIPPGWAMFIYSRSGHGFNHDVRLANVVGIIDSDYRGPVRVKLTRDDVDEDSWHDEFGVQHGDRIAQAVLMQVPQVTFIEVDDLSKTKRGSGGFGSTGVK